MKKFKDLKKEEITHLSDVELQKYIDVELSENGIPFMDYPKEPKYEVLPDPDLTLYSNDVLTLYSTNEKSILDVIKKLSDNRGSLRKIDYTPEYSKIYYEKTDLKVNSWDDKDITFDIRTKTVYSNKLYNEIKDILKRNKDIREKHDKVIFDWEEIQERINEIKDSILSIYYDSIKEVNDFNIMLSRYNEYLSIADNNKVIAMKFLKNTYTIDKKTEDNLINSINK